MRPAERIEEEKCGRGAGASREPKEENLLIEIDGAALRALRSIDQWSRELRRWGCFATTTHVMV